MRVKDEFIRLLRLRCPHCGESPMFTPLTQVRGLHGWFDTRLGCPRCEYLFVREPGYFLLATWGVVFFPASVLGTTLMIILPHWFSLSENGRMAAALLPALLFAVVISRHARLLFLIIDHRFDPLDEDDWKNYRDRMANEK
jgi:hypothetical protein